MFQNYFKPPFKIPFGSTKVFTSDNNMAFDFVPRLVEPEAYDISDEEKQKIVDIINGADDKKISKDAKFRYENPAIFLNDKPLIWIRSWGRLTGTGGGLGLAPQQASEIQNSFAKFIIDKLEAARES